MKQTITAVILLCLISACGNGQVNARSAAKKANNTAPAKDEAGKIALKCLDLTGKYMMLNDEKKEVHAEIKQTACDRLDFISDDPSVNQVVLLDGVFHQFADETLMLAGTASKDEINVDVIQSGTDAEDESKMVSLKMTYTKDTNGDVLVKRVNFDAEGKITSTENIRVKKVN